MSTSSPFASARSDCIFFASLFCCLVFLFWPGLFSSRIPAFRDTYHFYYPQAVWLDHCASRGDFFPAWNRNDGLGSSVPGQVSTAIYYPLRVIWLLPLLSVTQRLSAFIVVHLLIAAIGIRYATRRLQIEPSSARLAMVSFALSCPVLFQHNNLIFLTSAAWIGFALGALIDVCNNDGRYGPSILVFGGACSLMILGGDPHATINAFVIAAVAILFLLVWQRDWHRSAKRLGWLITIFAFVAAVTAIQWIPAARWSMQSNRIADTNYSIATSDDLTAEHSHLIGTVNSFDVLPQRIYEFSLSPWHIATLIWPTFGGHYLPTNARWFDAIPAEGRTWIPSVYFGLLPALFFASGIFGSAKHRWLIWLGVFSFAAALGNYSPVWLVREFCNTFGLQEFAASLPADQSVSIYGLLVAVLPGYDSFRYPAKWTVWFVASAVLFAAVKLDEIHSNERASNRWISSIAERSIIIVSLIIAIATLFIFVPPISEWINSRLPFDNWLGGAEALPIAYTLLFSAAIPLFVLYCVRSVPRAKVDWITGITMIEMTIVASSWTTFVDPPTRLGPTAKDASSVFAWTNISRASYRQHVSHLDNEAARQTQLQDRFLLGKLSSISGLRNLAAINSIDPAMIEKLKLWLASQDTLAVDQPELDRQLALLGVTHRLAFAPKGDEDAAMVPSWQTVPDSRPLCQMIPLVDAATVDSESGKAVEGELGRAEIVSGPPQWEWINAGQLNVNINSAGASKLLIRQYNDGGWRGTIEPDSATPIEINAAPTPFIQIEVPEGIFTLTLTRKWLW